jgi:hypothetical protein
MRSEPLIGGGSELPGVDALNGGGVTPDVCAASDDGLNASIPAVAAIPRKARLPVNIARPSLWFDLLFPNSTSPIQGHMIRAAPVTRKDWGQVLQSFTHNRDRPLHMH